jgi:hemerythrin-like domain-containing protein
LTREHDQLRDLGRDLVIAATRGDADAARVSARAMLAVLEIHIRVEEQALFPGSPEPRWPERARGVVSELFEHILKEQDGVFPAALSVVTPDEWDTMREVRESSGSKKTAGGRRAGRCHSFPGDGLMSDGWRPPAGPDRNGPRSAWTTR